MASEPTGPKFETDQDLGIGEELGDDSQSGAGIEALLASPAMQALIDAAVTARLAQMAAPQAVTGSSITPDAFEALAKTLGHMIEVNAMQQPGYIKPLPADEVDRRLAGKVEMEALLRDYQERGVAPLWEVGEGGFFECTNAIEFRQGERIRTFLPPPEDFVPLNEAAEQVHKALMQWLGTPTQDIAEQVEAAQLASKKQPPLITSALQPDRRAGLVEVVDGPAQAAKPRRRSMGSIVPERHDVSLAERASGPQGPVFVGADAA